jgi:aspartate racemase
MEQRLHDALIQHVTEALPNEGCGLIAFEDDRPVKLFPGRNVLESPSRYRMADLEVLRAVDEMNRQNWWLGAIYHSHPRSPARPSLTDLNEANWLDALMVIVSLMDNTPVVRAWRVRETATGRTADEVAIEVYRERSPLLANIRRTASRGFRSPSRPRGRRAIWQPVGAGALGASSGSEHYQHPAAPEASRRPGDGEDERRATIGILGGMGPLATADIYRKIIDATPATSDQEHIPVVIYADPRVPDRTQALLHDGDDPTPWLVHGARQLTNIGADFIIIPCNTAHAFLDQVQPAIDKPILSMIDAAADEIRHQYPRARSVGLLATTGTIAAGIYQRALEERGLNVVVPDDETQARCVMAAIHDVKGGRSTSAATTLLVEASQSLLESGADVLLEACTEIPIALQARHLPSGTPLVDATASLARLAIATARHLDESARSGDPQWETSTTGWGIAAGGLGGR